MPSKPPSVCSCGAITPVGETCPCKAQANRERKARHDIKRGNSTQRGYGSKWATARKIYLGQNQSCAMCGSPSSVVDHIIPHGGDGRLFWSKENWQPLCTPCHNGPKQRAERRDRARLEARR